ncbi:diguanylate cyclase/phosphodiesterase (GGDEF & EAL domains) with PAS/PAC sensor(s) [hydrothermal vent metagenome]|uniref:Diguanylate cyclase/phosphodiesterase (GGDEF & EAL domains) with PAS/PAC sensor(S) n=1 Tax=hydrothermal vent metagenome TaxID=652676 RepID=A0A3B0ZYM2_9ZZZZ
MSIALKYKHRTSQKKSELIPVNDESWFRELIEAAGDWLWMMDKDTRYIYSNSKIKNLLGYEVGDIIGKTRFELMTVDAGQCTATELDGIMQEQSAFNNIEIIALHKEGHQVTLQASGVPVFNEQDEFCGYRGFDRDVSEHRRREEAQALSHKRLVESQQIAQLGHWDWDLVNETLFWSDEVYRICGLEPGQIKPGYEVFLNFIHPDDREEWKRAVINAMSGSRYNMDHRIVLSGEDRYVHGQGQVQLDDTGKPIRMMGTIQDITERKLLESALNILADFHPSTGLSGYYRTCVESLARVYDTRYAFVGLFSGDAQQRITTQAVWANGEFVSNFEYDLTGAPCTNILDIKKKLISEDVARLFPQDTFLGKLEAESYFGAPLLSAEGRKMGMIAVIDIKPMKITPWTEPILGIFAQRISSYIERNRAEKEIKTSEKELRNIFRDMQDTYCRTDNNRVIIRLSESIKQLLDYQVDELLGANIEDLYEEPAKRQELMETLDAGEGSIQNFEVALKHRNGSIIWVSINAHYYRDSNGNILGVEDMIRDINQHRQSELQMQKMSSALAQSADMVMITDDKGIIEYINPAFESITGYRFDEAVGSSSNIVRSGEQNLNFYRDMWHTILAGKTYRGVVTNRKKNGDLYYEEKSIAPIKNAQGDIVNFVSTGRDISERMENEKRLSFMAHHDALTELPNRTLFIDRLDQALAHARRYSRKVSVLFIDLDRFKNINDTLGHDAGDQMLAQLADRLGNNIRQHDTVARLGGDEFAVLLNDIETEQDVSQLANMILLNLEQPFEVDGRELFITASIGICLFPDDGKDHGTLLKNADIAMYKAKELGKNNYQFYSADMSARAFQRLTMENSLRRALEREEFRLFYQPQIDIETNTITGVEALIRWQHPDLGMVSPNDFIPLLEETGLIDPVGYWVVATACKQMQTWYDAGLPELTMSVNISGRQFHARDFIGKIKSCLNESQVSPEQIEIEITESVLMENQQSTIKALESLAEFGFRIAIDDFGTGYSSLSYLRRFRIDTLKIDQFFIRDVIDDPDNAAITSAIIAMAQNLKLKIIAEGVETQAQLAFLEKRDCRYMQGYLFSRPVSADEITKLLMAQQKNHGTKNSR